MITTRNQKIRDRFRVEGEGPTVEVIVDNLVGKGRSRCAVVRIGPEGALERHTLYRGDSISVGPVSVGVAMAPINGSSLTMSYETPSGYMVSRVDETSK